MKLLAPIMLLVLVGCGQPLATVQPGAVQLDSQAFKDAVKASVLSPEMTLALSNHVGQMIAQARADFDTTVKTSVQVLNKMVAEFTVTLSKQQNIAASQPANTNLTAGGNATGVTAPITANGSGWAVVAVALIAAAAYVFHGWRERKNRVLIRSLDHG